MRAPSNIVLCGCKQAHIYLYMPISSGVEGSEPCSSVYTVIASIVVALAGRVQ